MVLRQHHQTRMVLSDGDYGLSGRYCIGSPTVAKVLVCPGYSAVNPFVQDAYCRVHRKTLIVKVTPHAPGATVTVAGNWAARPLVAGGLSTLLIFTTAPPCGAGPRVPRFTAAFTVAPVVGIDVKAVGDTVKRKTGSAQETGFTVSVTVLVARPYEAAKMTEVELATGLVLTVKVVVVAPAGTVATAGTVAGVYCC